MITNPFILIAITFSVVTFISTVAFLVLNGRRKKKLNQTIAGFLDDIEKSKTDRQQALATFLGSQHQLASEESSAISQHFIAAEKLFLQYFVKQQLEQGDLTHFYGQLTTLLDQYIKLVPYAKPVVVQAPDPEPVVKFQKPEPPAPAIVESDDEFMEVEEQLTQPSELPKLPEPTTAAETIASEPAVDEPVSVPESAEVEAEVESEPISAKVEETVTETETVAVAETNEGVDILSDEEDWSLAFAESDDN